VYSSLFKEWLDRAEEDRRSAHHSFSAGFYRGACFFAQQSIEKLFKAILIRRNIYAPIHSLVKLELIEKEYSVKIIDSIVRRADLERLSAHYILSRYAPPPHGTPDRAVWERYVKRYRIHRYDKNVVEEAIEVMENIWKGVRKLGLI